MNEPTENIIEQEHHGFEITDDHLAEWAVAKIKEAQSDTAKWRDHFAAQLAAIKKANDETVAFMTGALGNYFMTVPHKKTATQEKYELPSATLIRKQQQPEYTVSEDDLLAWMDEGERPEYIKIVRKPMWGELKKQTTTQNGVVVDNETGEIVRGVTVTERPDVFDVKIKEE